MRTVSRSKQALHMSKHTGATFIMWLLILSMQIGKVLHLMNELTRPLIRWLRMERFEAWLQRRDLDFVFAVVVLLADGFAEFKEFEIGLIFHGHVVLGICLGLLFKVTYVALSNYLIHVLSGQLLSVGWLAWTYERYVEQCARALEWMHEQAWYVRAQEYRRYSIFALASRSTKTHRCRLFAHA